MQPENPVPPVVPQTTPQPVVVPESTQPIPQPVTPVVPVQTPVAQPVSQPVVYASFGRRLAATLIDSIALGIVAGIISVPFNIIAGFASTTSSPGAVPILTSGISSLLIGILEAG